MDFRYSIILSIMQIRSLNCLKKVFPHHVIHVDCNASFNDCICIEHVNLLFDPAMSGILKHDL